MQTSTGIILSCIFSALLVLVIAPNVLRMNQGKILQNVALWLAIFLTLCLVYKNFGPQTRDGKPFSFSELLGNSHPIDEVKQDFEHAVKTPQMTPIPPKTTPESAEKQDSGSI